MTITGTLISKDDEHTVVKQFMTGYTYVCNLKDLEVEKKNGNIVMIGNKPSVRISNVPYTKAELAFNIKKENGKLFWG